MHRLKIISLSLLFIACVSSTSVPKESTYSIAFYNVENLFDTKDDPDKKDEDFLPDADRKWDKEKYELKLSLLASAIAKIGDDNGPEVLGLCEVENKAVLQDLVKQKAIKKQKYQIVHHESPDVRGIDNALIFKKGTFELKSSKLFTVDFPNDPNYKSRAILLVNGMMRGTEINFIVNHFPSRRGGLKESEPKRLVVAKKVREIVESLLNINSKANIVVMGDFNDEPTNNSIQEVLMAKGADFDPNSKQLFNTLADKDADGMGSYKYRGKWQMLDQILLSSNLLQSESSWKYVEGSGDVFSPEWLKQQTPEKYKGSPLRTFAGRKYLKGYSDHFPVFIQLQLPY